MNHTPGEWSVNVWCNGRLSITSSIDKGATWSELAEVWPSPNKGMQEANARLVAAAPELLEALSNVMAELDDRDIQMPHNYLKMAVEAINKATGGKS